VSIALESKQPIDGPLERVWSAKTKSAVMASALVDGRLVTGEGQGSVLARDATTGQKIWESKPGKCARAVHVVEDLVWIHDDKGFFALDLATGALRTTHALDLGASDVVWHGARAYFLETTKRARSSPKTGHDPGLAVAATLDLATGELTRLSKDTTPGDNPARRNVCIVGPHVAFFIAPNIVEYALADGTEVRRLEVPGCIRFSGLSGVDDARLGVSHVGPSRNREGDFASYLELNPTPVVAFVGERRIELAIPVDAALPIRTSLLPLGNGCYLAFAGEHVARIDADAKIAPLPDHYPMGTRGIALHRIGSRYVAFRWSGGTREYALHLATIDPETLNIEPLCSPLITHPLGKNYLASEVDTYGDSLLVRADGRLHLLRWSA